MQDIRKPQSGQALATHRLMHGGLVGGPGLGLQDEAAAGREQIIDAGQQRVQRRIPAVQMHPFGHAQAQDCVKCATLQTSLTKHAGSGEQ